MLYNKRKAIGARLTATSTRLALTEGDPHLPKRLDCDLEPFAPGARHKRKAIGTRLTATSTRLALTEGDPHLPRRLDL